MGILKKLEQRLLRSLPDVHSMRHAEILPIHALETHVSTFAELLLMTHDGGGLVADEERFDAAPGDVLVVPSGTPHRHEYDLSRYYECFVVSFSWKAEKDYFAVVTNHALQALSPAHKAEIARAIETLQTDLADLEEIDWLVARSKVLTILLMMLRATAKEEEPAPPSETAPLGKRRRRWLLDRARTHMESHYGEEDLSLTSVARALGVSACHLSHLFSEQSGFTFSSYLRAVRLAKAKALLEEGKLTIAQVAFAVGYRDSNYFAKVFRQQYGRAPSDFLCR